MKRKTRIEGGRILALLIALLGAARGIAATAPSALPFTNTPSLNYTDLKNYALTSQFTVVSITTSNDGRLFRGVWIPLTAASKLAIHSDDGSDVTINGNPVWSKKGVGTSLANEDSFKEFTGPDTNGAAFVAGQEYCVTINYSNMMHTAGDKDGVTLYAYDGGGSVRPGLIMSGGNDAVCVGTSMVFTVSCGTANYGWKSSATNIASVSPLGGDNSMATITGLAFGSASITATDSFGASFTTNIYVVKPGISPGSLTTCVGVTNIYVLTNSAGNGAVTWNMTGALTGNGRTNSLALPNAGTNILTASYAGCSVSATAIVVAVSSLLPVTTNFCGSGTVLYTNQTTPAGFGSLVNWGGEGLSGAGASRTNSYSTIGPHIVSNWCGTSVKYSTATVYRIDIAQTNATVLADATAPVTFYLTNSYGAATWQIAPSPGGGASFAGGGSGDTVTVNPGSVGTNYTITASADAMTSCSDTATLQVVRVAFNTNLVAFCEGTNASIAMTVSPSNFLSSLTFDTVTNVATGTPNTVASVTVVSTTNLTLNPVSPGTATLRVRLGSSTFFGPVVKVVRVTFPTNTWYVGLGRDASFAVDVIPPDAPVTYVSKDTAIVTASGSGTNVTANGVAFGTTKIIAVVGNSGCVEKDVTVARVTFSPTPLYICVSQNAQSTATITPSNAPVTYTISDPSVASGTVSGNTLTISSLTNSQTHVLARVGESVLGTLPVYGWRVEFEAKPFGVSPGKSLTVRAKVFPFGLSDKVNFATYHPGTAYVSSITISEAKPIITILGVTNGSTGLAAYIGTNPACAVPTITVASLGLENAYFAGTNRYAILKDDGSGSYEESFHWSPTSKSPLAYIRNSHPAVAARVTITSAPSLGQVIIKGTGAYPIPPTTNNVVGGAVTTPYRYASNSLPNSVNIVDPLVIFWKASLDGGETFFDVGASTNRVYSLLSTSLTANVFHSVVDVSCRNAVGRTLPTDVVSDIWSDFSGPIPGVLRQDGTAMQYWGPVSVAGSFSNICFTTADLVKYADGKCGAWAEFFNDTLRIQGIDNSYVSTITNKHIPALSLTAVGFDVYSTLPGQGNASPVFQFPNHGIVKYGGIIYDPSYGVTHASEIAWEDASIWYLRYTTQTNLDTKTVQETGFNP